MKTLNTEKADLPGSTRINTDNQLPLKAQRRFLAETQSSQRKAQKLSWVKTKTLSSSFLKVLEHPIRKFRWVIEEALLKYEEVEKRKAGKTPCLSADIDPP